MKISLKQKFKLKNLSQDSFEDWYADNILEEPKSYLQFDFLYFLKSAKIN